MQCTGSERPSSTISREDRHVVRMELQLELTPTSRTLSQEVGRGITYTPKTPALRRGGGFSGAYNPTDAKYVRFGVEPKT
ncbi:hypothetical protein TNCV_3821841 [Trichonephila clavipes]|nr:hypothetical protein TNCV_3821841 [Trichonephila clavipes]